MAGIRGIVKSITSGDTLVLISAKPQPAGKTAPERTLSLAFVSAPRLRREGDEVSKISTLYLFLVSFFIFIAFGRFIYLDALKRLKGSKLNNLTYI